MFFAIIATSALFKTQSQMVEVQFEMARYDKEIVSIVRKLAGLPTPSPFAFRDAAVKATPMQSPIHVYEVRPRKDHRGVDLISDALPFGRLWYGEPNAVANAIGYAKHRSQFT